jgi:hypothetical protein
MPRLIPISFGGRPYPMGISPVLDELPGHFDRKAFLTRRPYCLHTEYSAGFRQWNSPLLRGLDEITSSQRKGIPELWPNHKWGEQFAEFIIRLVGENQDPTLIEIHPPFVSYCKDVDSFLDAYAVFASSLRLKFPGSAIVIENRNGTRHPSKFLVSTVGDVVNLFAADKHRDIDLKLALDLPQIFSAHLGSKPPTPLEVEHLLEKLRPVAHRVETLHIWGRRKTAHNGTLDDLFGHDPLAKEAFFYGLHRLLENGKPRYFLLEVNSSKEDLQAIVSDFVEAGFDFAN